MLQDSLRGKEAEVVALRNALNITRMDLERMHEWKREAIGLPVRAPASINVPL